MAPPIFFSVLVILLVYVPVLSLTGVDGKMFRPDGADGGVRAGDLAASLTLTFIPAAADACVLRPRDIPDARSAGWCGRSTGSTARCSRATRATRWWWPAARRRSSRSACCSSCARAASSCPQLDEGDLVVQTTRAADIILDTAVRDGGPHGARDRWSACPR